ncbi:hypothetical protein EZV62_010276 [Acer yangbiense]|uniref:Pop1 N-terminal domain-containing protein n=1 Tax=Acer yangbiense TaxID=1000413 RepID=A0A5C7I498_9ROSI|nr:hypothetical protein EZV62_010276 [Acer yangbiense]
MASDGTKLSQVSSAPPRKINVQKFAESRASELDSLHSIVSNRLGNNFRSQRNKRRRTTAYDNQVAKKKSRKRRKLGLTGKSNVLESDKDQSKVSRRLRRRMELKKNPESGFSASGDGTKRLSTHVWHAKRFTMEKLWGFYLPLGLQGRGRGSRALLKWFKQGVVVHDASYHIAVQLEGSEAGITLFFHHNIDSLRSILQMVLVPCPSYQSEDISQSVLFGTIYGSAMLHHVGAPLSQPIVPVTYMWKPYHNQDGEGDGNFHDAVGCNDPHVCHSRFRQLWVWMHASAFDEGYNALKLACQKQMNETSTSINCFSLEGKLAKLEVIGSKAFQLLQKTLSPVTDISKDSLQLKKCSSLEADSDSEKNNIFVLEDEENISSCANLSFIVKDPRLLSNERTADFPESASSIISNNVQEDEANEHVVLPGISDKSEEFLSSSQSKFDGNTCFYDRSLWDANNGISPPVEENVLCMEKHQQHLDFICLDDSKSGTTKTSNKVQCSRSCPILLLKNNNEKGSPIGWSIILPLSWVRVFWVSFVSKGAHAIGLREKQWIACETGVPYFPSDFPDCNAYSSFMATEAAAADQKSELSPAAIRPLRVPIPSPWNIVRVSFDKVATGEQDSQFSSEKNMVDDDSLSDMTCRRSDTSHMTSFVCHGNSIDIIVARTTGVLTYFLNEIHGNHLPLFPQLPNQKTSFIKRMKNESKLGGLNETQVNYDHKLCFLRVLLHAYKEGVFEEGAVVCTPSLTDVSLWTSRSGSKEIGLEMPQSSVRSYFKETASGKWELQIAQDPASKESHRWPIGFVTTGFVRGSKKPVAEAFCEAVLLGRLREEQWNEMPVKRRRKEIYVLVRNLRSSAYRLALATIVLEQQEEDVNFM